MENKKFNLRVYGLLIKDDSVLITVEHRANIQMIKFPGGGLEMGEGIQDCVIREFEEELGLEIEVQKLYYVNDFYQKSVFDNKEQLISFYYNVRTNNPSKIKTTNFPVNLIAGEQVFIWIKRSELKDVKFTFPIDQKVAKNLFKDSSKSF